VQLEEITQSEGPGGVTITLWYSVVNEAELTDELEGDVERLAGELA
jgi:hypothetical protein